jgi:hypothetical protein
MLDEVNAMAAPRLYLIESELTECLLPEKNNDRFAGQIMVT